MVARMLGALAHVDVVLQLQRRTVEPVGVPGEDGVSATSGEVVEQGSVTGSRLARVGTRVVVDVDGDDLPPELPGERLTVRSLTVDAESGTCSVLGDATVDRRSLAAHLSIVP